MARKRTENSDELFTAEDIAQFSHGSTSAPIATSVRSGAHASSSIIDDSAYRDLYSFEDAQQQRFAMEPRARKVAILAITVLVVYALALLLPKDVITLNAAGTLSTRFAQLLQENIRQLTLALTGQISLSGTAIVLFFLVGVVGAGLAACGAAYQGAFRNAFATPTTLGVMSGASCGMVVSIMLSESTVTAMQQRIVLTEADAELYSSGTTSLFSTDFSYYLIQCKGAFCALVGAAIVVALTVIISKLAGKGTMNNAVLVIAGQVFSALANAFVVLFRLYLQTTGGQDAVSALAMMQTGDFSYIGSVYDLLFIALPVLIGLAFLLLMAPKLNLIVFGDEEARSMGLHVNLTRGVVIAACTVITAVIVAFCGAIAFVGFLIPHLLRRWVGPDFRYLLPASMLGGAAFLMVVYYLYRFLPIAAGGISLATTSIGAVVFIAAIIQERRGSNHEQQQA